MNSSTQAQKGFKTFLLTLVVSLIVFSAIYYVINSGVDADSAQYSNSSATYTVSNDDAPTVGTSETLGSDDERPESVFSAYIDDDSDKESVLAGADVASDPSSSETATIDSEDVVESTVPETGLITPTVGLAVSMVLLGVAAYILYLGPRRLALSSFEKDVINDLE